MDEMKKWDIFQVHWKHKHGDDKPRPALLLSGPEEISSGAGSLLFMKISTADYPDLLRFELDPADPDLLHEFAASGLAKKCFFYVGSLQRIERRHILHRRGFAIGELKSFLADEYELLAQKRRQGGLPETTED